MTSNSTDPIAGWYPDARIPNQMRWWDGTQWTDHTQPGTTAPASPYAASTQQTYGRRRVSNTTAWTSFAFGIIAMALAIAEFIPGFNYVFFSIWGIIAIVLGARALARRRTGEVTVTWPAVTGIVLGSIGSLLFLIGIIVVAAAGGLTS